VTDDHGRERGDRLAPAAGDGCSFRKAHSGLREIFFVLAVTKSA
jgi:hypothetical protein